MQRAASSRLSWVGGNVDPMYNAAIQRRSFLSSAETVPSVWGKQDSGGDTIPRRLSSIAESTVLPLRGSERM